MIEYKIWLHDLHVERTIANFMHALACAKSKDNQYIAYFKSPIVVNDRIFIANEIVTNEPWTRNFVVDLCFTPTHFQQLPLCVRQGQTYDDTCRRKGNFFKSNKIQV